MSGRHKFSDLEAGMTPERRERVSRLAEALAEEIDRVPPASEPPLSEALLHPLARHPEGLTPRQIREKLGLKQSVSGDQAVSDALKSLSSAHRIFPRDRKYVLA